MDEVNVNRMADGVTAWIQEVNEKHMRFSVGRKKDPMVDERVEYPQG